MEPIFAFDFLLSINDFPKVAINAELSDFDHFQVFFQYFFWHWSQICLGLFVFSLASTSKRTFSSLKVPIFVFFGTVRLYQKVTLSKFLENWFIFEI